MSDTPPFSEGVNPEREDKLSFPSFPIRNPEFVNALNNKVPAVNMYPLVTKLQHPIHNFDLIMFHQPAAAGTSPSRQKRNVAILAATSYAKTLVFIHSFVQSSF